MYSMLVRLSVCVNHIKGTIIIIISITVRNIRYNKRISEQAHINRVITVKVG